MRIDGRKHQRQLLLTYQLPGLAALVTWESAVFDACNSQRVQTFLGRRQCCSAATPFAPKCTV